MIKQILFDCAGVITGMQFREVMKDVSGSDEIAECFVNNLWTAGSPWLLYDKGELASSQMVTALREFLPRQIHPYLEAFMARLMDAFPPMAGMEEIIDALHSRGYKCYLLSNFPEAFEQLPPRIPALRKLDGMVISYRIHMLKPDPAIFLRAAQILGIDPKETVFVDDNLPNVQSAQTVGMGGHHFTSATAFKAFLQKQSILPTP